MRKEKPGAAAPRTARQSQAGEELPESVQVILATAGVYAVIDSAEAQQAFIMLTQRAGVTNQEDPNGATQGGPVEPGLVATGVAGRESSRGPNARGPASPSRPKLRVPETRCATPRCATWRTGERFSTGRTSGNSNAVLQVRSLSGELEVIVTSTGGGNGLHTVHVDDQAAH